MHFTDDSAFPFIFERIQGSLDVESVEAVMRSLRGWVQRGPFVRLVDVRGFTVPDASTRKHIAEIIRQSDEVAGSQYVARAIVLDNALMVGALRAVRWIIPPARAERATMTAREGYTFLVDATVDQLVLPAAAKSIALRADADWNASNARAAAR